MQLEMHLFEMHSNNPAKPVCVCIILAQNYRPCGVQMLLLSKKFKFTISLTRHFEVILSLGRLQVTIVRTPHVDKVARLG